MFTITTLRPIAFIATALHPNNVYVSADTLNTACQKGYMTIIARVAMQHTSSFEILTKCTDEEMLLDYVHDVEQMIGLSLDFQMREMNIAPGADYIDEIIGRIYMLSMFINMQEMYLTQNARKVMMNVAKELARGLQSLIADAEGCGSL